MIRLLSWNIAHLPLWELVASEDVDVALLQEVPEPPREAQGSPAGDRTPLLEYHPLGNDTWLTAGWEKRPWRTAIACVSNAVALDPITIATIGDPRSGALAVSRPGTLAAARVLKDGHQPFTVVSVYAPWERPLARDEPIWADGSAHRLLSDLAPLLWDQGRHPVVIAGDWNILLGYGEHGDNTYGARYESVFQRAEALGLRCVGPRYPAGRQADPWPDELPAESTCVPTFHHSRQTPASASRQLDFVFASAGIADRVRARALNEPAEWGPSDHCRIRIDVDL